MALCSEVEPPAASCEIAVSSSPWLPVKPWRISTRLSKSMTCAMSLDLSRWTKFDAACLQGGQVFLHARAAVEQQRQGDRLLAPGEERDVLLDTVLEDHEFRLFEIGDVVVGRVRDRDVQGDDVDSRAE